MLLMIGKKIAATFHENELQKANQKDFRTKKVIKRKVTNYMLNGTDTIIRLIAG